MIMSTQDAGADCLTGYECIAWTTETGRSSWNAEWATFDSCLTGCYQDGPGFYWWNCADESGGQGYRISKPSNDEVCSGSSITALERCFNGNTFFCCGCA